MYRVIVSCFHPKSVHNIYLGFEEAGCQVRKLFIGEDYAGKAGLLRRDLLKAIEEFKHDFIYTYGWWQIGVDLNEYLDTIEEKGIFHVYWAYDDPICFSYISLPVATRANLTFTTAQECIPGYKEKGIPAYFLMHGCYPPHHKRVQPQKDLEHDIVLLANNCSIAGEATFRVTGIMNMVKPLVDNNYDVKIWGMWWTHWDRAYRLPEKYFGGFMPIDHEAEVYSSAKIALGLQSVNNSITHCSVRTFEAMACGVFHLSQYSPALETYFKKGIHMEWTKSPGETIEIVNFYLKNENSREKAALNGQREVYENHTLLHRARQALDVIKEYI